MSTGKKTTPSQEFLGWYNEFGMDENLERVSNRYNACIALVKSFAPKNIATYLEVLFSGKKNEQALVEVKSMLQKHDALFGMNGSDREAQVLSGIIISMVLKGDSDNALGAAMSLLTTSFDGGRTLVELPMDLLSLARLSLQRISINRRKRTPLTPPDEVDIEDLKAIQSELPEPSDEEETGTASSDAEDPYLEKSTARTIVDFSVDYFEKTQKFCSDMVSRLEIQDEELDILWWLYGERSQESGKLFSEVPELERSLVFGKELAGKTQIAPGPVSVKSVLLKAGVSETKKPLGTAVDAVSNDWVDSCALESTPSLTMPIHTAIACRKEFDNAKNWKDSWVAKTQIPKTYSISGISLAQLFYFERLLLRISD